MGSELASQLAYEVMAYLERERDLQERAGEALKMLRTAYEVITAEFTSGSYPEYGTTTNTSESKKRNFYTTVRRPNFPPNVADTLVLHYADKNVEGIDEFLKMAAKYDALRRPCHG